MKIWFGIYLVWKFLRNDFENMNVIEMRKFERIVVLDIPFGNDRDDFGIYTSSINFFVSQNHGKMGLFALGNWHSYLN